MKIKVTKSDIKNGEREHCAKCPVALAIKRTFKSRKQRVYVDPWKITIGKKTYITPLDVATFVLDFDCGIEVEPFTFTLELE
jgi:hypothetical protein